MGLDIYHFRASDAVTDNHVVIDVAAPQIRKLASLSHKKTNQYFDYARLLIDHGFSPQDYRLVFRQRQMWGIGKFADNFYFCGSRDPDHMNPTNTAFFFTNKKSLFPVRPNLPPQVLKKLKKFKVKEFPMEDRLDDKPIGYQRNQVIRDFFRQFPPDFVFAERPYAQRVFELTIPEAQQDFRSNFLNNWDEQRSLVVISF